MEEKYNLGAQVEDDNGDVPSILQVVSILHITTCFLAQPFFNELNKIIFFVNT
jgi:hypothetical protein